MKHACRQVSQLASDALERELNFREKMQLKWHTAICSVCHNYQQNIRRMHVLFQRMQAYDLDENVKLSEEARQSISQHLRDHQ